jgi:flagellar protein FlgJ
VDVNGLGAMYLGDLQSGGSLINRNTDSLGNAPDFAEMLKRTADAAQGGTASPHSQLPAKNSSPVIDKTDKLYEQCMELEIFLVKTLITSMRSTVQKSGLIDEGFAGKMYEDMLYDEYARDFTKNANFGMADLAYLELTGQRGALHIRVEQ